MCLLVGPRFVLLCTRGRTCEWVWRDTYSRRSFHIILLVDTVIGADNVPRNAAMHRQRPWRRRRLKSKHGRKQRRFKIFKNQLCKYLMWKELLDHKDTQNEFWWETSNRKFGSFPPQGTFNINNNNYLILYFPQHNYFTNIEKWNSKNSNINIFIFRK